MVVPYKNKSELYKQRVLDTLKEYGKLPKSKISYLSKLQFYDTEILIKDLIKEGRVKRIEGLIVTYGLGDRK